MQTGIINLMGKYEEMQTARSMFSFSSTRDRVYRIKNYLRFVIFIIYSVATWHMTRDVYNIYFFNGIKRPSDKREPSCSIEICRRGFTCVIRLVTLRQYMRLSSLPARLGATRRGAALPVRRDCRNPFPFHDPISLAVHRNASFHFVFNVVARDERDEERWIILWFHRGSRVTLPGTSKSAGAPRFVPPLGQIAPSRIYPRSDSNFFARIYPNSMITSLRLSSTFNTPWWYCTFQLFFKNANKMLFPVMV